MQVFNKSDSKIDQYHKKFFRENIADRVVLETLIDLEPTQK